MVRKPERPVGPPAIVALVALVLGACGDFDPLAPYRYSDVEVDYFLEIALGFEFGDAARVVRKWGHDVDFRVQGSLTQADRATLDDVVADVNGLTSTWDLVEVDGAPSVEVYFAPEDSFPSLLPSYTPGNIGYFTVWWGGDQHLIRAVVLIASDVPQTVRDHLIREEMTQMLGMGNDSRRYPDSIFQQAFSTVTSFAPIDEAVIEILYRPEIGVGLEWDAAKAGSVARSLFRGVVPPAQPSIVAAAAGRRIGLGSAGFASGGHGTVR